MREIRFRGRDIDNEWLSGGSIDCTKNQDGKIIDVWINGVKVNLETIGQYTGIKDKNGKRIYEGDIVEVSDDTYISIGVIEYSEISLAFMCNILMVTGIDPVFLHEFDSEDFAVIGNVHDNLSLLE